MNLDRIADRLHQLPPPLAELEDRFEQVRRRVTLRRRRLAAGSMAGACLLAAAGIAIGVVSGNSTAGVAVDQPSTASTAPTAPAHAAPGSTQVTRLAPPVTVTGSGTETIQLGARPAGADSVVTGLWCLSAGQISWPDGAASRCDATDAARSAASSKPSSGYTLTLAPGQTSFTMTADPGVAWRVVATYVHTVLIPWAVNAHGQTYGVENANGSPDLVSVDAPKVRRAGYVYASDLRGPIPSSPADAIRQNEEHPDGYDVPVYESDGTTVIGRFHVG
jgi:hypothetical protein